jgi:hypothetical protein
MKDIGKHCTNGQIAFIKKTAVIAEVKKLSYIMDGEFGAEVGRFLIEYAEKIKRSEL